MHYLSIIIVKSFKKKLLENRNAPALNIFKSALKMLHLLYYIHEKNGKLILIYRNHNQRPEYYLFIN